MKRKSQAQRVKRDAAIPWVAHSDPSTRELLDHIARQLADEYVRLMKGTGEEGARKGPKLGRGKK